MRIPRVFATGLGDQNMVIEDVTIQTETSGRKQPKTSEVLVLSVRPTASQAGRCSRCRKRCPGYDAGGRDGDGTRRWRTLDVGTTKAYLQAAAPRVQCPEAWGGGRARAVGTPGRQTQLPVRGHLRVVDRAHRDERGGGVLAGGLAYYRHDRGSGGRRWP